MRLSRIYTNKSWKHSQNDIYSPLVKIDTKQKVYYDMCLVSIENFSSFGACMCAWYPLECMQYYRVG